MNFSERLDAAKLNKFYKNVSIAPEIKELVNECVSYYMWSCSAEISNTPRIGKARDFLNSYGLIAID